MKNIYITNIPLQKTLEKQNYVAADNFRFKDRLKTVFPIVPVIDHTFEEDEAAKLIAIGINGASYEKNLNLLKDELAERGITNIEIEELRIEDSDAYANGIELFLKILEKIDDDSVIRACPTYGEKGMSITMLSLLQAVPLLKKNVEVLDVVYGKIPWTEEKTTNPTLYDISGLLRLNSIIVEVSNMGLAEPETAIRKLIELGKEKG